VPVEGKEQDKEEFLQRTATKYGKKFLNKKHYLMRRF